MSQNDKIKKKFSAKLCTYIEDRDKNDQISDKIRTLIEEGADVNFQSSDFDGNTPLHIAVEKNDVKCAEFLLEHTADLDIRNDNGETAFDLSKKNGNSEILTLFQQFEGQISEVSHSISSKYILEVETLEDFTNFSKSNIKIIRLRNCLKLEKICEILESEEFHTFVERSPGLFALDFETDCCITDLDLKTKLQNILIPERSWIVQVRCCENDHKILYKEANESVRIVQKSENSDLKESFYLELMKKDCNFENLMQGFFFDLLGKFERDIFNVKITEKCLNSVLTVAAENNLLCLRFLLAFYDLDHSNNELFYNDIKLKNQEKYDKKCLKLLLNAVETDNLELLRNLLDSEILESRTFPEIALELKQFKCLEEILRADSPFPRNFDPLTCDLSDIIGVVNTFHENIRSGSMENVKLFVNENSKIKFAYDSTNKSAINTALETKQFKIYAYLRSQGFLSGVEESFNKTFDKLTHEEKNSIEKENLKFLKASKYSYILHIESRIKVAGKSSDNEDDINLVGEMIEELDEISEIRPLLKAVEFGDVKIVFDFNHENVNEWIPTLSTEACGACNFDTGHIYIAARDCEKHRDEIMGTLIHEISHYVINLVYSNECKPFFPNDKDKIEEYNKIMRTLYGSDLSRAEPKIKQVFGYKEESWAKELIVRVPQILAKHKENPNEIKKIKKYAGDLFEFYNKFTLEDIKTKSDLIQPKQEVKKLNYSLGTLLEISETKFVFKTNKFAIKPSSSIRLIASNAPTFSMVMIFKAFYEIYEKACECHVIFAKIEALNSNVLEKLQNVMNSSVKPYLIVDVSHNSKNEIEKLLYILKNKKIEERIILVSTLNKNEEKVELTEETEFFSHRWEDLDDETQKNLLKKLINFQGCDLTLEEVIPKHSGPLKKIQLQNLLSETLMEIGKSVKSLKAGFVIPRNFLIKNYAKQREDEIGEEKTFNELLEDSETITKMLISDMAGTGKTVMLKEIAMKLKEKYPNRWVSFMDLKDFFEFSEKRTSEKFSNFEKVMLQTFYFDYNDFDKAVFEELYAEGRTILLFDSFDEISPYYKQIVINFIKSFEVKGGNQICVTTRSHLEGDLSKEMEATIVQLEALTKENQIEFLMKSWIKNGEKIVDSENLHQKERAKYLIEQMEQLTPFKYGFVGLPILLGMIATVYKGRQVEQHEKLSFFEIYQNFIEKMFSNWRKRVAKIEETQLDLRTGVQSVMEIHQRLAIEHIFRLDYPHLTEKNNKNWTNDMILRVGIITKIGNYISFLHETFAEFLVARYLTDIIENNEKTKNFTNFLLKIVTQEQFSVVRSFLNESLKNVKSTKTILGELKTAIEYNVRNGKYEGLLRNVLKEGHKNIFAFLNLQNLDKYVLLQILKEKDFKRNIFFHAAESPTSMIPLIEKCFEKIHDENQENEEICEMLIERDEQDENLITYFNKHRKSEEVFDDLCSILTRLVNRNKMKNMILEKDRSGNFYENLLSNYNYKMNLSKVFTYFNSSELFKLFAEKDKLGRNFLLNIIWSNENYLKDIFEILNEFPTDDQKYLLECEDNEGKNIGLWAVCRKKFPRIFECLQKYYSDDVINVMLHKKTNENQNILVYASWSTDDKIFSHLMDCFQSITSKEEAKKIILKLFKEKDKNGNNVIFHFFKSGSEILFDDFDNVLRQVSDPNEIKALLLEKNFRNENILTFSASKYSFTWSKKLLNFLKLFLDSSELFGLLNEKGSQHGRNAILSAITCYHEDIGFIIQELFEILKDFPTDLQKIILKAEDYYGFNILHHACRNDNFQKIFKILKDFLNDDEIKVLLRKKNNNNENIFSNAFWSPKPITISQLINCIESVTNEDEANGIVFGMLEEGNTLQNLIFAFKELRRNTETDFDNLCLILKKMAKVASSEEMRKLLENNFIDDQNLYKIGLNLFRHIKFTKVWDFLKFFRNSDERFKFLIENENLQGCVTFCFELLQKYEDFQDFFEILKEFSNERQKLLLKSEDSDGCNLWHWAVRQEKSHEVFELLRNYYSDTEIKVMLQKKTKTNNNILSLAAQSRNTKFFIELFNFIKSVTNEDEAKKIVLELFKNKNDEGDNIISCFFVRSGSEELFDDMRSVLEQVASPEEMKTMLKEKNVQSKNVLFHIVGSRFRRISLSKIWNFLKTLNTSERCTLLAEKEKQLGRNVLLFAVSSDYHKDFIEDFFELFNEFSENQRKLLLKSEDNTGSNILHLACHRKNFSALFDCLKKFLTNEEIITLFSKRTQLGQNIFSIAAQKYVPHIFNQLLNCIESITNINKVKEMVFKMLIEKDEYRGNQIFNIFLSGQYEPFFDDFCLVLTRVARKEEIKNLLLSNYKNLESNIARCLFSNYFKVNLRKVWRFLKKFLNTEELFELLMYRDRNGRNVSFSVFLSDLNSFQKNNGCIRDYFEILNVFRKNQQKILLESEDSQGWNILHYACYKANFSVVFECLKNSLTNEDIKIMLQKKINKNQNILSIATETLSHNKEPFPSNNYKNLVSQLFTCIESITNEDGAKKIIFGMFSEEEVFHEIFFSFDNTSSCDFWSQEKFDYCCSFIKSIASPKNIKNLFMEKKLQSRNLLGSLVLANLNTEIRLLNVWSFLKTFLNSEELFELLCEKDKEGRNALFLAVSKQNEKFVEVIFEILKEFPNNQKIFLDSRENVSYSILHYACSTGNSSLVSKRLKLILNENEIKKIFFSKSKNGNNIFYMGSLSLDPSIFSQLIDFLQNLESENEVKKIVLEMFKERSFHGFNAFSMLFAFGTSTEIFNGLSLVLSQFANLEEMKSLILETNSYYINILGFLAGNSISLLKVWSFLKTFLSSSELFKLLIQKDDVNKYNSVLLALSIGNVEFFKDLFKIMEELSKNEQKQLIESQDEHENSILHFACKIETKIFPTIIACLNKFISLEEIREIFWKANKNGFIPLHESANLGSLLKLEEICEVYIGISNENELKKMFLHKTISQQNVFHIAAEKNNFFHLVESYENLLKKFFSDSSAIFKEMMNCLDSNGKSPFMLVEEKRKKVDKQT